MNNQKRQKYFVEPLNNSNLKQQKLHKQNKLQQHEKIDQTINNENQNNQILGNERNEITSQKNIINETRNFNNNENEDFLSQPNQLHQMKINDDDIHNHQNQHQIVTSNYENNSSDNNNNNNNIDSNDMYSHHDISQVETLKKIDEM